jgi:hypothetical protein
MHKHGEDRTNVSADNNKSSKNPHLSDEQLLLALDGELSPRESARVGVHLEACWSCRARSQQIEEAIADIVEYRDCLVQPYSPLPTGGVENFVAQLEHFARTLGRSPLRSCIVGQLRALRAYSKGIVPRHAWISAFVVVSFALLLFIRFWEVPHVSASHLLEGSRVFEVREVHSVTKPVVYQKLRIRIGPKAVTRTIYRDPVGMRQVDHLQVTGGSGELVSDASFTGSTRTQTDTLQAMEAETELQRTFLAAHLNWEDPLSPASYSSWHDSLSEKRDEITADGHDSLILKTATSEGSIAEARITVRATDFHPIAEELHLQDTRVVEVKEIAWEVLSMEAINPAIFSREPSRHGDTEGPTNLPPPPEGPSEAQLAEAELQARVAMHVAGADLGEQIELDHNTAESAPSSGQRSVIVRGIVSTPERRNALLTIFRGIRHVVLRLQTVEEAIAQQRQATRDEPEGSTQLLAQEDATRERRIPDEILKTSRYGTPESGVVEGPALEQQLEALYRNSEDRTAFINRTVELVQDAVAQAWALRRLRDRYTPEAVAELSRGSQQTLELLIRDHVSLLREHLDATRNLVSPLFPLGPIEEASQPSTPEGPGPATVPANDWRSAVTEVFTETQSVCDDVVALIAVSAGTNSETQARVRDLQIALAKLQTQVPALYERVNGSVIVPTSSSGNER